MKKAFLIICVIAAAAAIFPSSASAADDSKDTVWTAAVQAYSAEDYQTALQGFLSIEEEGYMSADLFYNIGNCYFKVGNSVGKSILYYERALRFNPAFKDAANNLALARQYATDKIDKVPEFVLVTWVRDIRNSLSSNGWSVLFLVLLALVVVSLLALRFGRSGAVMKTGFVAAIVSFLTAVFSFGCALSLKNEMTREDRAVVTFPVSSVKGSPSDSSQPLFILHEGTDVSIIEALGTWCRVELADGRQGWIKSETIEII